MKEETKQELKATAADAGKWVWTHKTFRGIAIGVAVVLVLAFIVKCSG